MQAFKRHPVFAAILLMLGVAVLAGIGLLANRHRAAQAALATLAQKQQERDALNRLNPSPTEDNARAIEADVAQAGQVLAVLRAALQGQGESAQQLRAAPPASRMDAYFELATFVEKTRALAARAQVALQPDERFGFATYANEGPSGEHLAPVIRQCRLMRYLMETLIESRPRALLSVQRERPLTAAQREARHAASASADGAPPDTSALEVTATGGDTHDFFTWDEKLTARVPGYVDTEAFRLEFTGQTSALRAFLNTLASLKLPLFVRSVEAETLAAAEEAGAVSPGPEAAAPAADSSNPAAAPAPVPLVGATLSRFTLILEYAELLPPPDGRRTAAVTP